MWKCPKCGSEFARRNQDHYCVKPQSIDEYIAAQDEGIQPMLMEIRTLLKSALPEATEHISWSMPTYWKGSNIHPSYVESIPSCVQEGLIYSRLV